jgi:hypothetical protein
VAEIELHDEVADWIAALSDPAWERVVVIVDRLADVGSRARMPPIAQSGDGLFELRFTFGPTARRITYRFTKDGGSCC